jgi:2-dehydro-3-deoxyphosphogluconate aldolase/(4S)-4-hydroxy-2-oxoglutarate aldolase
MAGILKHEVVAKILDIGLLPTFYNESVETAKKIVDACVGGGAKVVEFTNRGALAYQVFSELVKLCERENLDIVLGAGTALDPAIASLYINSGQAWLLGLFSTQK